MLALALRTMWLPQFLRSSGAGSAAPAHCAPGASGGASDLGLNNPQLLQLLAMAVMATARGPEGGWGPMCHGGHGAPGPGHGTPGPGQNVMGGMSQAQAVQSKVDEASQRLYQSMGLAVPTKVVDDGQKNGYAFDDHNQIHTGLNPAAVPGVKFHEDAHVLLDRNSGHMPQIQKELRADAAAGYALVKAGYGASDVQAFMNEIASFPPDADHGTPQQRIDAVMYGVNMAMSGA